MPRPPRSTGCGGSSPSPEGADGAAGYIFTLSRFGTSLALVGPVVWVQDRKELSDGIGADQQL